MSNLALRVVTAVVALPLVGALISWREPLGFGVLVLVVAALALDGVRRHDPARSSARRGGCGSVIVLGVGLSAGALPGAGTGDRLGARRRSSRRRRWSC